MSGFFNIDGPFYRIGSIIADLMILSFLWIVFSIPVITMGASTTALYYVMTRRISNREGYLFRDFWTSFKSNFKQATIICVVYMALFYVLAINIRNIDVVGDMRVVVYPVQVCVLIEAVLSCLYIFPLNARFEVGLKDSFKTAFFMANRHLLTSIGCVLVGAVVIFIADSTIILWLAAMPLYVYFSSFLLLRVFRKYRPEIDQDPMLVEQATASAGAQTFTRENLEAIAEGGDGAGGTDD